jgi:hypothetical protein
VLLINLANPPRLLLSLGLFVLGVLLFFGCLQGLHRQLLAARLPAATSWNGQASSTRAPTSRSGPARRRPWVRRRSPFRLPR